MNPFDQPPAGTPISLDPPAAAGPGGHDSPRRARMAIAALAAAGLVGGGIVVAGQFASADRPTLDATETRPVTSDDPAPDAPADEVDAREDADARGVPSIDGEIVIGDGDGDPLVLDLGGIGECLAPIFGGGPLFGPDGESGDGRPPSPFDEEFQQRMEEFLDGRELDELDDGVRIFWSGGSTITVVGPGGVEVIDLGDGDATVTIEQTDGELTIETDGDATVGELPDIGQLLPNLDELDPGELDPGEWDPGEWQQGLPFDPEAVESCLDELGDGDPSDGS